VQAKGAGAAGGVQKQPFWGFCRNKGVTVEQVRQFLQGTLVGRRQSDLARPGGWRATVRLAARFESRSAMAFDGPAHDAPEGRRLESLK
jgi:hypothetical protein